MLVVSERKESVVTVHLPIGQFKNLLCVGVGTEM